MNTDALSLDQLRHQLALRRITLTTSRGKLIVDDPAARLTPVLDRAIRQYREVLLNSGPQAFPELLHAVKSVTFAQDLQDLLVKAESAYAAGTMTAKEVETLSTLARERAQQIPYGIEDMPVSQFATSGLVRQVHSPDLGEDILQVADDAQIPADNDLVVYRPAELHLLNGVSPGWVKAVHAVKKALDGEVIEPGTRVCGVDDRWPKSGLPASKCYSCGQERWWVRNGRQICKICHPPHGLEQ